jgi:hypothetical protein
MRLFKACDGRGHLRKHGRIRRRLAGKSRYFCNSSVIFRITGSEAEILRW